MAVALRAGYVSGEGVTAQATATPAAGGGPFGFGRPASAALIASENIDVRPDGQGLPPGSGTVAQGQAVYAATCAICHGDSGSEGGRGPVLVDSRPFVAGVVPATVGNYWPYPTTVWDYINRAMPFDAPGSLSADEVYAVTAYLLNANGIIPDDALLNAQTLPQIVMPNLPNFISPDPRPDVP
ncbi:MAG: c-type cytochrome [Dehalococcoidia bacterium]